MTDISTDTDRFATDAPQEVLDALGGRRPTDQQWAAISAPLEPTVLIAGAGSGKTAVMAARIVWLIANGHAEPTEILGLTFTNKAAANLLERVRKAIAPLNLPEGEEPTILTYHAFAASLIADYGLRAGLEPGAALLSEAQAWQLCSDLFANRTYESLDVRTLYYVGHVRHLAGECADHLVDPDELIRYDREFLSMISSKGIKVARDVRETAQERIEIAQVVKAYQETKRARHLLDYGDQIAVAAELAADEQVAADFRSRFKVALLDEYQDTNHAQAVMLRRLMPTGYPVMAVGDPDQNIYAWRGASLRNLLRFADLFPIDASGTPANTKPLVINFRSGRKILALANMVIEKVPEQRRPKDKILEHFPETGPGEVHAMLVSDQVTEAERIVDAAAAAHETGTPWAEIAVLCRKKRLFGELVEAFRHADVPVEVIGLGGLLRTPEVGDLVALLRVLEDPLRNVALARLLRGPRWRIGHRDLALIARRAAERNRDMREMLGDDFEGPGDVMVSLAEALAAAPEIETLGDEARERIAAFDAELTALRASTGLPLPELAAEALDVLGLARELDASPKRAAVAAKRNLANFLDRIAAFEPLEGEPTLSALIEYLDAIEGSEEEIEAAQPTEEDSVKLMTIHQAKGLEYDIVFLPGLAAGERSRIFPDTQRQPNPHVNPKYLPFRFRGDAEVLPDWDNNLAAFRRDLEQRAMEEERRLLYVGITRARKRLVASAAHWYYPSGWAEALKKPMGPSLFFEEILGFEGTEVIERVEQPEENPLVLRRAERAKHWPPEATLEPDPLFPSGLADAVEQVRATTPVDETLFPLEAPAQFPSGERARAARPKGFAVSSLVTYQRCPQQFFWTAIRPLPRRSSSAARIGTIVHAWIEQLGRGQITLYDPEQFEEREPNEHTSRVAELKGVFERTRFAGRTPLRAEAPFALVAGDVPIHGRIDAIFESPDGTWEIVDWKSGRAPETEGGPERWQLELYALAAQEIWGRKPDELTLSFLYLGESEATERFVQARPAEQIRADLEATLAAVDAGLFEPTPSKACSYCDFLRDCAAGRAFVASSDAPRAPGAPGSVP